MKEFYKIGEISKLLGLTIDAIRFYERKGLVHPAVDESNQYRMYDLYNILELLDVIFYRHLDFSVKDMQLMMEEQDQNILIDKIQQKRKECILEIKYKKMLLNKFDYLYDLFQTKTNRGCIETTLKESIVLFSNISHNGKSDLVSSLLHLSQELFVLGNVYKIYDNNLNETKMLYTIEKNVLKNFDVKVSKENEIIKEKRGLSITIPSKDITKEDLAPIYRYANENDLCLSDQIFVHEISTISYNDPAHNYLKIFIEILT